MTPRRVQAMTRERAAGARADGITPSATLEVAAARVI